MVGNNENKETIHVLKYISHLNHFHKVIESSYLEKIRDDIIDNLDIIDNRENDTCEFSLVPIPTFPWFWPHWSCVSRAGSPLLKGNKFHPAVAIRELIPHELAFIS